MRITIKKCSYPYDQHPGWYDKFFVWLAFGNTPGRTIATCDTKSDAELVRDALKEHMEK